MGRKLNGDLTLLDNLLGVVLLWRLLLLLLLLLELGLELGLRLGLSLNLDGVGLHVGRRGRGCGLRSNLLVGDWLLGLRGYRNSSNSNRGDEGTSRSGRGSSTGGDRHAVEACGTVTVEVHSSEDEGDDVKDAEKKL